MTEFDLIARYFIRPAKRAALGVGDDCALINPAPGMQLAISSDMLVEGRHFFHDVSPYSLGHKALAVNLSDLAACGATPVAFTLALALPSIDEVWLQEFSRGLWALAGVHGCELIGGDTTQGPLNICITVFGEVPRGRALLRSGARVGDDIYVSGKLGDARLALEALQGKIELPADLLAAARQRLEQPTPRVALGMALRGIATSAIDISDGLAGDLGHILKASGVGARVDTEVTITLIAARAHINWATATFDTQKQLEMVFSGGDDYELAFTAPPRARGAVQDASSISQTPVTRIGVIESQPGLRMVDGHGQPVDMQFASFDHFAA
ncbi:MAG: thiamine-phosphate kinase [Vitreoscilla sp.]|nr:thiamine-phosphate kinase [Polaromonas sp.]